jgi:hypothetical protein
MNSMKTDLGEAGDGWLVLFLLFGEILTLLLRAISSGGGQYQSKRRWHL